MSETLGGWLRRHRERRNITLDAIAQDTKISVSLLDGLERDDVSRWPKGIFRRAFVKSYARAIGLDCEIVVQKFQAAHPEPADADWPAALTKTPAVPRPVDLAAVAAVCTRIAEVRQLSELQSVLDSMLQTIAGCGAIVWTWNAQTARLTPIAVSGYSPTVVMRLGGIARDAENAVAIAFRTARMSVVAGKGSSNGAIVVAVPSPEGAIGALAVEVPAGREGEPPIQAVISLCAAPLATILSTVRADAASHRLAV